jgi:gluconate 2-dehydrogenase subunit 3-like protein
MNRRTLLKNAIILGGGMVFIPACGNRQEKPTIAWKHFSLSAGEEDLVAEMTETLIPATDTPGAKALEIPHFVLMMVDDCYSKDQQVSFVKGLQQTTAVAEKLFHRSFEKCGMAERFKVLQTLPTHTKDTALFYKLLRELTREGYLKSKYVMTKLVPYELVPGRYNGYFPLKQQQA